MKKKLVVLTGAGMSAESGISTFRDTNGLWENYRVEDVATPEGFAYNPELVLDFYNQRRRQLLKSKPNAGHLGLAALEKDFDVRIITQNVDNLHEQAGSTNVIHLHGELMKSCSVRDLQTPFPIDPEHPAAGLLNYVRRGQPIYLIDPKDVNTYRKDITFLKCGASEGVKRLTALLQKEN